MAWEGLSIDALKGLLGWWWNRRRVKITRLFTTASATDPELRVEVFNSGNRDVYIRKVAVEGAGQPAMTLLTHRYAEPGALASGDRRIYGRPMSVLSRFARQEGVRVVVRSNARRGRDVLARRGIPPSWWPNERSPRRKGAPV